MTDKITVLMTTYNTAKYLPYSIKSILNQTYSNFEFLIIDDGSEDNTEQVIKSFDDNRIKYMKIAHAGRSKALNIGLREAKTDLVALMDADDIAIPDRLTRTLQFKSLQKEDIIFSDSIYFQGNRLLFLNTLRKDENLMDKIILNGHICNSSVIFFRQFIIDNGGYDESLSSYEDYELWLRLKDKLNFIRVPEVLLLVRILKGSSSSGKIEKLNHQASLLHDKYLSSNEKGKYKIKSFFRYKMFSYIYRKRFRPRIEYIIFRLFNKEKHKYFTRFIEPK